MKNNNTIIFYWFFLGFICSKPLAQAQENKHQFTGGFESIGQWYVDDDKTGNFIEKERFRSNNYLKGDYFYKNFSAGLQLESYAPMTLLNFNPNFDKKIGLATYYIDYQSKYASVTVGHLYEQFGSGLALRSWEDRQLGVNNAIRGGRIIITPVEGISLTGLYGNIRKGFNVSKGSILGTDLTIGITNLLKQEKFDLGLGFSYVKRFQKLNEEIPNFNPNETNLYSTRLNFNKGGFNAEVEYVYKDKDLLINRRSSNKDVLDGDALLINAGYGKRGFGINATFRRLENIDFYAEREAAGNDFNEQVINYIPSLTKQYDYSLANIYVYQAQPKITTFPNVQIGEIGGSVDVFYSIKRKTFLGGKYGLKLGLNYSSWHGLKTDNNPNNLKSNGYFSFGEKYYEEFSGEIRKKWSKSIRTIFTYIRTNYNKQAIEQYGGLVKSDIAIAESMIKINSSNSIRLELQHLFTENDTKSWYGGTLELNLFKFFGLYVTDIYNYGNDDLKKRIHYYNSGVSFTKKQHRFTINYGRQRGGLLCVGGVCRIVPESTGLSFTLSTSF